MERLQGAGVLLMMAYTGRFCPKGIPFQTSVIHFISLVEIYERVVENLSFGYFQLKYSRRTHLMAVSFYLFTTHKNDKTSSFVEYGPVMKVFERGTISQRKVYEKDIFLSKWYKKGKGLDHAARHYHLEPW